MTFQELDFWFPFVVLFYGAIMCIVLNNAKLMQLAEERLPYETWQAFKAKRALSLVCFLVGAAWSLQNIWLG
jgi:hypothetical protein